MMIFKNILIFGKCKQLSSYDKKNNKKNPRVKNKKVLFDV